MHEKTVVSRRPVKDVMQIHKLKPSEVKITKELKNSILFAWEHYCDLLEHKKREDLLFKKQEGEDQEIRKRELQDLQNKRDKAKRQLASIDKEIGLLTKIKKVTEWFEHFF